MNNPLLSIVIVNYNGMKFLKNCLESIYREFYDFTFEIIVVDNCSLDSSIEFIESNFPKVILVKSDKNLGFGRANNLGVLYAQGRFLLLLNNDTIIKKSIKECFGLFDEYKDMGAMTIKMLDRNNKYSISVGRFPNPLIMWKLSLLFDKRKEFQTGQFITKKLIEVDWFGGSFVLLKTETFKKINGFDLDYFMYVEDVDFCKRISDLGLKNYFFPKLEYIHFVGFNSSKNETILKGYEIFIRKNHKGFYCFLNLISLKVNFLLKRVKCFFEPST